MPIRFLMSSWTAPVAALLAFCHGSCLAADRPEWAFFVPSAESHQLPPTARGDERHTWHAPGSPRSYSSAEIHDVLRPPDWYPAEHPEMPPIVAQASTPTSGAPPLLPCALCHLPNGAGHAESASLAGLPVDYMVRQFDEMRSGARSIAVGNVGTAHFLSALKSSYSQDQILAAARYYASLEPRRWIRVVETSTVPKSAVDPTSLMRRAIPGGLEPLGQRIVELPENETALLNRDAHSGYVAYVPRGSIAAGKTLVMTGAPGTGIPCNTCHGARLTGFGDMPPLAGRPPSYLVRQLWAFQSGERHGAMAGAMQVVASRLSTDQMLAIAAYLASLPPESGAGGNRGRQGSTSRPRHPSN
jgi:cytochrome c553